MNVYYCHGKVSQGNRCQACHAAGIESPLTGPPIQHNLAISRDTVSPNKARTAQHPCSSFFSTKMQQIMINKTSVAPWPAKCKQQVFASCERTTGYGLALGLRRMHWSLCCCLWCGCHHLLHSLPWAETCKTFRLVAHAVQVNSQTPQRKA